MSYLFVDVGTLGEWNGICKHWKRPNRKPTRHISSVSKDELVGKVVYVYKLNKDKEERDIGLIRLAGSSTPEPNQYMWVCGINSVC